LPSALNAMPFCVTINPICLLVSSKDDCGTDQ
jgi:hypothetical protein